MKKSMVCALSLLTLLFAGHVVRAAESTYQLEQVLMLSRHNLRAPLANNGSVLDQATTKPWPQWQVAGGELTTKGGILEVYMGNYTRAWLSQQGLIRKSECPDSGQIFAYANSLQRTVATAQYFIIGAFPGCDIPVTHQDEMGMMDPVFNPVVTGSDAAFQQQATEAMKQAEDQQNLEAAFQQLDKIVDYKNAPVCKGKKQCSLTRPKQNHFSAKKGAEPAVVGPLKTGNALIDAFTLQYYEGFPEKQVAWGQIKTPEQWKQLSAIKNSYQDILFTSAVVAGNVSAPLVDYMRGQLFDQALADAPRIILMVGHDSNIASVLSALKFKAYDLPGQFEKNPVGGQVVFQRWRDKKSRQEWLKVEYVYQTTEQLRDATPLSLKTPPQRVLLQMEGCAVDANGFCAWDTFKTILDTSLQGQQMQTKVPSDSASAVPLVSSAQDKVAQNSTVVAQTKAAAEKVESDRIAAEKLAKEKKEAEKIAAEKAAKANMADKGTSAEQKTGAAKTNEHKKAEEKTTLKAEK
ncbi:bifunctional glucose-1-phosphatase/inositol phosphatase [Enterobacteriaceae bacterium LUAb1]